MKARTRCLAAIAGAAAGILFAHAASAQGYPERPVRLIVPFSPGGTTDILARTLGTALGENLGQQVIPDNRPGASGNLGTALAAKAAPDGYTLLLGVISPLAINVTLFGDKLPYDPIRDFAPVSLITKVPQVVSMHPSVPARSLRDLIALAKAHPGKLTFASAGSGTSNHLVGELIKASAGIRMQHIPYKGAGPGSIAVMSGEVDMMISAPPAVIRHFESGRMRPLVVSSLQRSPALPDVPTIAESGFPGFDATAWYCMVAPAGTPSAVVAKVRGALIAAMKSPPVSGRLLALGAVPESSTPEELHAFMKAEIPKWGEAIRIAGAKVD